ncbi:STAS domain-containing protein [Paenibacillus hemerocallicola]|uniref:STAS domain-containing protein n=1 Tax=Paenibacillus hemerocallicola TaxID=1172614 RepID=A0A5C4SVA3_9BACL|nr:SulP family inorganic anion transporter [Paenibacillus hemerocallicola]TNJ55420.1 STAS domain-containing protein [Paenibacillus hemerocallicola]
MKASGRYEGYGMKSLRRDLIAGLIVGIVAIPLGMAFAIASGVKPQYGIYTTIVAGILISLLGGSKFQIGGPTGAFIPILLAVVLQYGYDKLLLAGVMAGVILVLMGLFKLGALIKFIPRPVTIGFTSGIAVVIFSGQIANFLGLTGLERHEHFWPNMREIARHLSSVNGYSVLTALISLAILLLLPKRFPKLPASLIALLVSGIVAAVFFDGRLATIGSTYGAIPSALPTFAIPYVSLDLMLEMLRPALLIALLGGFESLLSAVVADGMSGSRHNSNRELIGQGIANIVTPMFGGIPATGAIARTATNIRSGAASPLSGIIHGFVVLLTLVVFAPLASSIPLAAMAPILMVVAWNMSERKEFALVLKTRTGDSIVLAVTFALTVFTDLTTAVEAGLAIAVLLFVKRMSANLVVGKEDQDHPELLVYAIEGPLFFGTASRLGKMIMPEEPLRPKTLLLRMEKVPYIDSSGEYVISVILKTYKQSGVRVLVSGIRPQPESYLNKTGLARMIGRDHFFAQYEEAVRYALGKLDREDGAAG